MGDGSELGNFHWQRVFDFSTTTKRYPRFFFRPKNWRKCRKFQDHFKVTATDSPWEYTKLLKATKTFLQIGGIHFLSPFEAGSWNRGKESNRIVELERMACVLIILWLWPLGEINRVRSTWWYNWERSGRILSWTCFQRQTTEQVWTHVCVCTGAYTSLKRVCTLYRGL